MGKDAFEKRKELMRGKMNITLKREYIQLSVLYRVQCCMDRKPGQCCRKTGTDWKLLKCGYGGEC